MGHGKDRKIEDSWSAICEPIFDRKWEEIFAEIFEISLPRTIFKLRSNDIQKENFNNEDERRNLCEGIL
jgi:hypothetical protein